MPDIVWNGIIGAVAALVGFFGVQFFMKRKLVLRWDPAKKITTDFLIFISIISFSGVLAKNIPNPFVSSYAKTSQEFALKIQASPEFKKKFGNMTDAKKLSTTVADLVQDGLPRLGDKTLLERTNLMKKIVEAMDIKSCAALTRNQKEGDGVTNAVKKLDQLSQDRWFNMLYTAAQASLLSLPPPVIQEKDSEEAYRVFLEKISEEKLKQLQLTVQNLATVSDKEVCEVERTVETALSLLNDQQKVIIARMLLQKTQ